MYKVKISTMILILFIGMSNNGYSDDVDSLKDTFEIGINVHGYAPFGSYKYNTPLFKVFYKRTFSNFRFYIDIGGMGSYSDEYYDSYVKDDYIVDMEIKVYNPNDSILTVTSDQHTRILNSCINIEFLEKSKFGIGSYFFGGLNFEYSKREDYSRDYNVQEIEVSGETYYSYVAIEDLETKIENNFDYFVDLGVGLRYEKIWWDFNVFINVSTIKFNHERLDFLPYISGGMGLAF